MDNTSPTRMQGIAASTLLPTPETIQGEVRTLANPAFKRKLFSGGGLREEPSPKRTRTVKQGNASKQQKPAAALNNTLDPLSKEVFGVMNEMAALALAKKLYDTDFISEAFKKYSDLAEHSYSLSIKHESLLALAEIHHYYRKDALSALKIYVHLLGYVKQSKESNTFVAAQGHARSEAIAGLVDVLFDHEELNLSNQEIVLLCGKLLREAQLDADGLKMIFSILDEFLWDENSENEWENHSSDAQPKAFYVDYIHTALKTLGEAHDPGRKLLQFFEARQAYNKIQLAGENTLLTDLIQAQELYKKAPFKDMQLQVIEEINYDALSDDSKVGIVSKLTINYALHTYCPDLVKMLNGPVRFEDIFQSNPLSVTFLNSQFDVYGRQVKSAKSLGSEYLKANKDLRSFIEGMCPEAQGEIAEKINTQKAGLEPICFVEIHMEVCEKILSLIKSEETLKAHNILESVQSILDEYQEISVEVHWNLKVAGEMIYALNDLRSFFGLNTIGCLSVEGFMVLLYSYLEYLNNICIEGSKHADFGRERLLKDCLKLIIILKNFRNPNSTLRLVKEATEKQRRVIATEEAATLQAVLELLEKTAYPSDQLLIAKLKQQTYEVNKYLLLWKVNVRKQFGNLCAESVNCL